LTAAVTGRACIGALLHEQPSNFSKTECNTCGLQFYPVWNLFFPGNFFAAQCSYIKQLIPPLDYANKMESIVRSTYQHSETYSMNQSRHHKWVHDLYKAQAPNDENGFNGLGKFSNEHWIGSHPSIKPSDLMGGMSKLYPKIKKPINVSFRPLERAVAKPAPSVPIPDGKWFKFRHRAYKKFLQHHRNIALMRDQDPTTYVGPPHEYYMLPGILYRFYKIYGEFPNDESWIWKYYPQGEAWKNKINHVRKMHGIWDESYIW